MKGNFSALAVKRIREKSKNDPPYCRCKAVGVVYVFVSIFMNSEKFLENISRTCRKTLKILCKQMSYDFIQICSVFISFSMFSASSQNIFGKLSEKNLFQNSKRSKRNYDRYVERHAPKFFFGKIV
jgi:hypothetical protein